MLACIRHFLYDWQTLASGILALIAAGATVWVMRGQIKDERRRHKDALYRKSLAARAQMPDALSALSRFTEACVQWADRSGARAPDLPLDAINVLKNGIEFVDSKTATSVFELVSLYQVHNARLFSHTPPIHGPEAADRLYDATRLRCLVDRLFPYARNEVQVAPQGNPTKSDMMTALKIITGLSYASNYEKRYEQVCDLIAKRHS